MSQIQALTLIQQCLWIATQIVAPALVATVSAGSLLSVFQAATQIQEQSLSFLPKVVALGSALAVSGGWMMTRIIEYSREIFITLPDVAR